MVKLGAIYWILGTVLGKWGHTGTYELKVLPRNKLYNTGTFISSLTADDWKETLRYEQMKVWLHIC